VKVTSIFGKVVLLAAVLAAFLIGLFGTIRLSLRNPEVKVPNVVGKDKATAEAELASLGLNLKARMTRYVPDKQPNTILDQSPQPDSVVKKGLPVAVIIARAPKEGEAPEEEASDEEETTENTNANTSSGGNSNAPPAAKKPVNKNTNKNANTANKNGNKNGNSNSANKNGNNSNGNKNANANNANANKGNGNKANANNANKGNANRSNTNANSGNRNRRTTPEP
jgi:beta-lactam-binding protein with PASTA domain